jgi:cytoskeletal protein RodZ
MLNKKVGDLLKETRLMKGLKLDEVSEALKINKSYLKALEDSKWEVFPAEVYIKGFLKNYSNYLGISEEKAVSIYRRERYVDQEVKVLDHGQKEIREMNFRSFQLTRTSVAIIISVIGLIGVLIFSAYQIFIVQQKPVLELSEPVVTKANTGEEIKYDTDDDTVTINGTMGVGDTLFVNGEQIFTFGLPEFEVPEIDLKEGENKILIQSMNQFGIKSDILLVVIKS